MHVSRKGLGRFHWPDDICSLIEDSENYIDFMSEQIICIIDWATSPPSKSEQIICIMMQGHIAIVTLASQYLPFSQSDDEPLRRPFVTE